MHMLIVDDDMAIRDTLDLLCQEELYEVSVARNGVEALQMMAQASGPMVVILDMWMPGMSGEAVLEATVASEGWEQRFSFIAMTASPQHLSAHAHALMDRYGIPLLVKPFDIEHVAELVRVRAMSMGVRIPTR